LRRDANLRGKETAIVEAFRERTAGEEPRFAHELRDDQLRMMLMCCHPAIPRESRIALTLKTVGGFSVDEIARAFLTKKETIAQRIVRAKRLIREERIPIEMPSRLDLPQRLDSVLEVVYLLFNEGYAAHAGEDLIRTDLCTEAIRLARQLVEHPSTSLPEAHALLALLLLQSSRTPARTDASGELVPLEEQDRSLWDQTMLAEGLRTFGRSATGDRLTAYHVEAAIAACHAAAPSFEETDWSAMVDHYDQLLALKPTPVVALNRAVAIAMAHGPAAGIRTLHGIAAHPSMREYTPLAITLGELHLRTGDRQLAAEYFTRALDLPGTMAEKRFVLRKLEQCRA
jgi:RNA polymerase sigma-70 factor (ECF subfamily)